MTSKIWLRIAACVAFLYFAGHSVGQPWTPSAEPAAALVVDSMKNGAFELRGRSYTYWQFYVGFGTAISAFLALLAMLLWALSTLPESPATRALIVALMLGYAINGAIAWKYFFALPAALAWIVAVRLPLACRAKGEPTPPAT